MNQVVLTGRATKDFDLRYTPNGVAVANGTIAVDRPGSGKERETDFINLVAWKQTAELSANYIKKGHRFGLTGRLQVRSYDKNGEKKFVSEVVIDRVEFLESKNGNDGGQSNKPSNADPFAGESKPIDIDDSDLPF